jgi:glutathione S-transferase
VAEPILFGAAYSVYVRAARLALVEKGVPYRLVEVDVFAEGGPPADYLERHPFGRIPAFEHDGFRLYETGAITRYVEEAFDGPPLMPRDPKGRARVNQIASILDNYGYRPMVWDVYVERVAAPKEGRKTDEAKLAAALPRVETCLGALDELADPSGPYLLGAAPTLADLHAAPMLVYLTMAPEGEALLDRRRRLSRWWPAMRARPSMAATRFPSE